MASGRGMARTGGPKRSHVLEEAMMARIVLISGSPGAGKTSVSRILAETSAHERAVHLHTDDLYAAIRKGYIAPWMSGSNSQNETVIASAAACAERMAAGGYEVFVDGVIGPRFIAPWLEIAGRGVDVRYIFLRPDERTTVSRVMNRKQNETIPLEENVVTGMWRSMGELGAYEAHALDTSAQTADETAACIQSILLGGGHRLFHR